MTTLERLGEGLARVAVASPTLPPATHTNVWVLGRRAPVLVDPGCTDPEVVEALLQALPEPPGAIFLTHHHIDHAGGAAELVRRTGVPVWAHRRTAGLLDLPVDRLIEDQEVLDLPGGPWTALLTPGHAPGHLCLSRPDGTVVAGDMVAGVGTILLDPSEGDLADYLASLDRLAATGARRLLPAHGPILPDAPGELARLAAHRHARSQRILGALRTGPATPGGLVAEVYAEVGPLVQQPLFQAIAARQILTHLRWLADRHEVSNVEEDGPEVEWTWHAGTRRSRS